MSRTGCPAVITRISGPRRHQLAARKRRAHLAQPDPRASQDVRRTGLISGSVGRRERLVKRPERASQKSAPSPKTIRQDRHSGAGMKKASTNNHTRHAKGRKKRLRPGQPAFGAKLSLKVQRKFVKHVREGLAFETVCALSSISRATFYSWMQRGRAEPGTRYAEFEAAVQRAEADAVRCLHIRIATSRPEWILERRHPALYGPPKQRLETELSGSGGAPIPIDTTARYTVKVTCSSPMPDFPTMPMRDANGNGNGNGQQG
jgi:hypothetical protein